MSHHLADENQQSARDWSDVEHKKTRNALWNVRFPEKDVKPQLNQIILFFLNIKDILLTNSAQLIIANRNGYLGQDLKSIQIAISFHISRFQTGNQRNNFTVDPKSIRDIYSAINTRRS